MAAEVPDPKTLEVANKVQEQNDLSFLNAEPSEFDSLPPDPKAAKTPEAPAATPEPAPAVESAPAHPASLIEAAHEVGITDRAIAKLDTDELIEIVLAGQAKAASLIQVKERKQRPAPEPETIVDEDERELADLATEFGEENKFVRRMRKDNQKLKQLTTAIEKRAQDDAARSRNEQLDAVEEAMESLGEAYEPIVGKGSILEVDETTKDIRNTIYLRAGIAPTDSARTIKTKIKQTAQRLYGKFAVTKPAAPAATPPAKANGKTYTEEEWNKGRVATPTNVKEPRAKQAANAAIRDRMVEMGVYQNANKDEFDGLPD